VKKLVILGIDHGHYKKIIEAAEKCADVELIAIAHETDNSAEKVAKKYDVKLYDSYEKCIDQEKPDIAGIAMFNGARGRWVIKCLEKKIAIITDKPLCTNLADLEKIEKAVKEYKIPLSMMLTCRCDPRFVAIRKKVQNGAIGHILSVDAVRYYALNRPTRPDWMFSDESYGGPGLDILIHDYDLARWITGIEWNDLNMCEIRTGKYNDEDFKDIAFLNSIDNKRILNLKILWHSPQMHWDRFTVYGTKGVIEVPLTTKPPLLINANGEIENITLPKVKPFAEQFFDALRDNTCEMPISENDIITVCCNILKAKNDKDII
jgi:predicted dehydrogenase